MPITKYNGEKVVRCGGKKATPYLRKHFGNFRDCREVLDLGCGEGRNSRFLREKGITTHPFDMCPDYGKEWHAMEWIPLPDESVDGVLLNYILMFLDDAELENVVKEIYRVTEPGSIIMVELELVKTSYIKTPEDAAVLKQKFLELMDGYSDDGYEVLHDTKMRFILAT